MTADIPAGLTGAQPDRQPARGEPALGVRSAVCVTASAAVLAAVLWAAAWSAGSAAAAAAALALSGVVIFTVFVTGTRCATRGSAAGPGGPCRRAPPAEP